jgi:hypothetical protein
MGYPQLCYALLALGMAEFATQIIWDWYSPITVGGNYAD